MIKDMKLVSLFLTCTNTVEADTIVKELFAKKLVACVKQTSVDSTYKWQGKIESNEETLLIMDTSEEKFPEIEAVVKKLHSYDTPVLTAYPIVKSSIGVSAWMRESLSD